MDNVRLRLLLHPRSTPKRRVATGGEKTDAREHHSTPSMA